MTLPFLCVARFLIRKAHELQNEAKGISNGGCIWNKNDGTSPADMRKKTTANESAAQK